MSKKNILLGTKKSAGRSGKALIGTSLKEIGRLLNLGSYNHETIHRSHAPLISSHKSIGVIPLSIKSKSSEYSIMEDFHAETFPKYLIDKRSKKKIAKGVIKIDAKIDLHGLDQNQALALLKHRLPELRLSGKRLVIVVTGKGRSKLEKCTKNHLNEGFGVLHRLVPIWLALSCFKGIVTKISQAALVHGGSGSLYVMLKSSMPKHTPSAKRK